MKTRYWLLSSVLGHGFALFILPKAVDRTDPQSDSNNIVVRINHVPKVAAESTRGMQPKPLPRKGLSWEGSSPTQPNVQYHQLLPMNREQWGRINVKPEKAGSQERYLGDNYGEVVAAAENIRAEFDLPLVARRDLHQGEATSLLELKDDGMFVLRLAGTPVIRAALFEALQTKVVQQQLRNIFKMLQVERLGFSVVFQEQFNPNATLEFDNRFVVLQGKVELRITRFLGRPEYGVSGVVIEDRHSRRAKWKDRKHLARLEQSPAFKRPLRDVMIKF